MNAPYSKDIYIEGGPWENKYERHDYIKLLQPIPILLLCPTRDSCAMKLHPVPVTLSRPLIHEYVRTSRHWHSPLTGKKHTIYRHIGVAS